MNRATGPKEPSFSLPHSFRLHQRQDFLRFFEGSEVVRFSNSTVFRVPNQAGHFRLGLTFKIRCTSVERNALRRRIRESFRRLGPSLGAFDYNVVIRRFDRPARVHARKLADELMLGLPQARFQATQSRKGSA